MTLRSRLALGFALIAVLLGAPLFWALQALQESSQKVGDLRKQEVAASILLGRVRSLTREVEAADRAVLFRPDSADTEPYMQTNARALAELADSLRTFELLQLTGRLQQASADIEHFGAQELAAARAKRTAVADSISDYHIAPAVAAIERALADAEATLSQRAQDKVSETAAAADEAYRDAATQLAAALLLALVVAVWITSTISRPVRDLEAGMRAVADGDFDHPLPISPSRRDEFGRLASSFRSMAGQLAELDKIKAEFVSVASHELKTPINVVLGYLTLLEDQLYGPLNEKQLEVLATVENQAQVLSRLVQHLLDVSRFQAGAARLEPRPMSLRAFVTELEQTFDVLAQQGGVTFRASVARDLPEVVTWDRDRMTEVLSNLLSNAFKFTETGGRVELTAVAAPKGAVRLAVRDTGAGIPAEQLAHVFDKFFQADNQSAATHKGSGLGLAIAREIVEAHGGGIHVASTRGAGTTFTIELPAVTDERAAIEPAHGDAGRLSVTAGRA
ncbi:ATP-binding protein [Roseisolibacter sp. H3M3-2]|uniref:sensor histidine kinase n=1 Tax=Roseisolibacter sp. H3M3-2 TaxID=3031323 RepID=UPI0023DB6D03|nr:ATP-binding protein [Roseisolibacter sp. H3M3-2]MDF1503018.1 ATP-binding protein [Roseisolibacter sp. H3M3-2]